MPNLLFSNGALLAGLTALAAPVLIHLLLRRKKQRLIFSTNEFFTTTEQRSTRHKLHHWLLLLIRLLIFALVILAFARPYLPQSLGLNAKPAKKIVFVLDASASMNSSWSQAIDLLRTQLQLLGPSDQVALIRCSTLAETVLPWSAPDQLKALLPSLQPDFGSTELSDGLRQAAGLFAHQSLSGAAITVISDFQRTGCGNLSAAPIPKDIALQFLSINSGATANLAVGDIALDPDGLKINAANFSETETRQTKLELKADGVALAQAEINLEAGLNTNVTMPFPKLTPGWHQLEAQLKATDALAADNVRYQSIYVPETPRMVCLEPRTTPHVFSEASFFLVAALNAGQETNSPGALEKITPSNLAARLSKPAQCVLIPALAQIPSGCGSLLENFAQQGGSIVFFTGEDVSAHRYNNEFGAILPAVLRQPEGDPERPEQFWHIGAYDHESPLLRAFRQPNSGNLLLPEFRRRFSLTASASAEIPVRFDDGEPFVLTRKIGQGQVILINTSADASWTDWPKRKTFVPWLHGLVGSFGKPNEPREIQAPASFNSADQAEVDLGRDQALQSFQIHSADGPDNTAKADAQGRVKFELPRPGIYNVIDTHRKEISRLAANLPARESDLLPLSPAEFERNIPRPAEVAQAGLLDLGRTSGEHPLWPGLLLAALGLLLLELLLANWTKA